MSNVRLLHCSISASAEGSDACIFPWVLLLSLRLSNSVAVFTGAGLCAASQQDAADGASAEGDRHWEAGQEILQME